MVRGFMVESYLEDGSQKIGDGCYGKSITDPCLGWDKTERLIYDLADLLEAVFSKETKRGGNRLQRLISPSFPFFSPRSVDPPFFCASYYSREYS